MIEQARRRVLLEVAIASVDDAVAAQTNGADRLELNSALELGGLTPSPGSLLELKRTVLLPLMVMIRPRAGDFVYGAFDFQIMLRDLDLALEHGADGIVFGMLTGDGRVDLRRCREIVRRIGARQSVFHRAFDVVPAPLDCLEQLIDLGVQRVLTSGQQPVALQGADMIAQLIERAANRIEVLPAAGIHPGTVTELVKRTGCHQVHASLREGGSPTMMEPRESFRGTGTRTDARAVADMRKILDSIRVGGPGVPPVDAGPT
jgi:copper homeostasis protein